MTQRLVNDWDDRLPWNNAAGTITATEILRGDEETDLIVITASSATKPTKTDMQALFRLRSTGGVTPILLAVAYTASGTTKIALQGLYSDDEPTLDLDPRMAEQLLHDALIATSPTALQAEVRNRLQAISGGVASGVRNEGLLASHVLDGQPTQSRWTALCDASEPLIGLRGTTLLDGLGFSVEAVADGTVLRSTKDAHRRAAVVLLNNGESFDNPINRLNNANAVQHGLQVARRENVNWVIVLGGSVLRLYPVNPDVGVGRKGQTQTFIELDLAVLPPDAYGYLSLLFSVDALQHDGFIEALLTESARYATGLSERLRDRIYVDVIPALALAVADSLNVTTLPSHEQSAALEEAYHQTMIILFRLLFVAYAEDRGLLPYETSPRYRRNALKTLANDLLTNPAQVHDPNSTSLWSDLTQVWSVIDTGDLGGWGVPAYNGGMFTQNPDKNASGAATYKLDLRNDTVGPALHGLLIDVSRDGVLGPVDFRSLSVREFGTIYEGLLESGLEVATTNLTLDAKDLYVPAYGNDEIAVAQGEVYFHSNSGSRKATGSYFTKPFAVEHLLDSALEPAITKHLAMVSVLIEKGATKSAASALFDFRVIDLAMGSAHFPVAAIDRIESRLSAYLVENPLPEVAQELHVLRQAAGRQLGLDASDTAIDDGTLLRRQIARRCIYGADINEIAVELGRLAVWIHTFVPGLPLSFLNHGLIHGNSLTGIGTLGEIVAALQDAEQRELKSESFNQTSGLEDVLGAFLERSRESLVALGSLADASVTDVAKAGSLQAKLEGDLAPLAALCDLITAERMTRYLGNEKYATSSFDKFGRPTTKNSTRPHEGRVLLSAEPRLFTATDAEGLETAILAHPHLGAAQELARSVAATHFPVQFPEVFVRSSPGFDCILGNPPWEKVKVETDSWWGTHSPLLRSMPQNDKNKTIVKLKEDRPDLLEKYNAAVATAAATARTLSCGPYPGIGATDIELASAFCWRFLAEVRDGGYIGVVLPRGSSLAGAGTSQWRTEILSGSTFTDVTLLLNTRHWSFDAVEPRLTIGLVTIKKNGASRSLALRGPYSSMAAYMEGMDSGDAGISTFAAEDVLGWAEGAAFPMLPSAASVDVFAAMRRHPNFGANVGEWSFRPVAELHGTAQKHYFDFNLDAPEPQCTMPVWTGETFNLWAPEIGEPYAYADPHDIESFLLSKRLNQIKNRRSAFAGQSNSWAVDPKKLATRHPRIVFRDVARSTDTRTMLCALAPPGITPNHKALYLHQVTGTSQDEAYVLGMLSSRVLDWFTRRYVETTMSYGLLNSFPMPRVNTSTGHLLDHSGEDVPVAGDYRGLHNRVIEIAGRLAAVDKRYKTWANAVGVPVGSVTTVEEKTDLIYELDACVALLFGLTEDQVVEVFATFHVGWDATVHTEEVLRHYAVWAQHLASTQVAL